MLNALTIATLTTTSTNTTTTDCIVNVVDDDDDDDDDDDVTNDSYITDVIVISKLNVMMTMIMIMIDSFKRIVMMMTMKKL